MIGPMPYPVVNTLLDDGFPKGALNYWKSAFFTELSDAAVRTMVDAFEAAPSIMSGMVIEHFHGEVTRIAPTATAFPHRQPGYNLALIGEWDDPAATDANIAWVRETFAALEPYMAPQVYVNYLGDDDAGRIRNAYGPNYDRLARAQAPLRPREPVPPQPEHRPGRLTPPRPHDGPSRRARHRNGRRTRPRRLRQHDAVRPLPTPGWDRDVYYCSFSGLARISARHD